VSEPEVIDYQAARQAFPRYERAQFRVLGINQYLRLRRTSRDDGGQPHERPLGVALAVIAVAQLMVVLDVAVVNVALPSIQKGLHFSSADLEWVVNAYTIAFGGLLLLGGRMGDLFGRRRMFVTGTLLFTLGSLAGGLATSSAFLIAARAAQGVGGAIVAPTALALLADTFTDARQRVRALGVYSAVSAGGGALGLLLGGFITNYFSWRWILFINVPVGVALALVAPRVLVATNPRKGRLDLPGAALVTGGATLLVYSLSRTAVDGWDDGQTMFTLVSAIVLLAAFVAFEAIARQPLMPLRIFANRNRSGAYALSLGVGAVLTGLLFLLTLFVQNILGFTPVQAGFAFLPTALGVIAGAAIASRTIGRVGPRTPMTVGALLAAIGLFWLSAITPATSYFTGVFGPLVVLAIGLGQIFVSTTNVTIAGVGREETGLASALLNVGRQLGGSLGIAVMGTIAARVNSDELLRHVMPAAAVTHGFSTAFAAAGAIALGGFVIALLTVRTPATAVSTEVAEAA
jgi:EmrB/QacA subfamily drug resistance transporter